MSLNETNGAMDGHLHAKVLRCIFLILESINMPAPLFLVPAAFFAATSTKVSIGAISGAGLIKFTHDHVDKKQLLRDIGRFLIHFTEGGLATTAIMLAVQWKMDVFSPEKSKVYIELSKKSSQQLDETKELQKKICQLSDSLKELAQKSSLQLTQNKDLEKEKEAIHQELSSALLVLTNKTEEMEQTIKVLDSENEDLVVKVRELEGKIQEHVSASVYDRAEVDELISQSTQMIQKLNEYKQFKTFFLEEQKAAKRWKSKYVAIINELRATSQPSSEVSSNSCSV